VRAVNPALRQTCLRIGRLTLTNDERSYITSRYNINKCDLSERDEYSSRDRYDQTHEIVDFVYRMQRISFTPLQLKTTKTRKSIKYLGIRFYHY
jgi:hypothetical protein